MILLKSFTLKREWFRNLDRHSQQVVQCSMNGHASKLIVESLSLDKDLTNLVNTVEVEIGGQKIDKHYSAWLDIYNELFERNHDYEEEYQVGGNKG